MAASINASRRRASLITELVRKGIHFLIALTAPLAAWNLHLTLALLYAGTLLYMTLETLRLRGLDIPLISRVTRLASRPRDEGRFVAGPVTLAAGAALSLVLFSHRAATIAILALAFGDGFSGIFGRVFGTIRPRFLCGKSVEGSFSCFVAVAVSTYAVTADPFTTIVAALTAVVVEALPLRDADNIVFPLAVGLAMSL